MKKALGLLCLLLLLFCVGCAKDAPVEVLAGTYVYGGTSVVEMATLIIEEDHLATFYYSLLSSTIHSGTYTLSDDTLTLETDGSHSYVFAVEDDSLVFDAQASSPLPYYANVSDGAVFLRSEKS